MTNRTKVRTAIISTVFVVIAIYLWEDSTSYIPDGYLSPRYFLWKHHLFPMEPKKALDRMNFDPDGLDMLLGSTENQLIHSFGYVKTVDQVRPYLRDYCAAARPNASVLFLNDTDNMVVMKDGRVIEFIHCED